MWLDLTFIVSFLWQILNWHHTLSLSIPYTHSEDINLKVVEALLFTLQQTKSCLPFLQMHSYATEVHTKCHKRLQCLAPGNEPAGGCAGQHTLISAPGSNMGMSARCSDFSGCLKLKPKCRFPRPVRFVLRCWGGWYWQWQYPVSWVWITTFL